VDRLIGIFGIISISNELKEKIAIDVNVVLGDPAVAERLKANGQVIRYGGPKDFSDALAVQRAKIVATIKAIDYKPIL
jgi:tripartite-type tricarboxylate transporter receptor subunit TctC